MGSIRVGQPYQVQGGVERAPQLGGRRQSLTGREPELSGLRALLLPPLIVHLDDDDILLALISLAVRRLRSYRVESFVAAEDALAFCRAMRPAVLITDVLRPDIDGLSLCGLIRADSVLSDLPLMIHSAWMGAASQVKALGAVFVSKPCDPHSFCDQLDSLVQIGLERHRS